MIREDFFDIASFLRENYTGIITLSTNGTLITKDNVAKLCDLVDQIDISIDGIDEESCAKIRGRGVFGKVLNSVDLIHECDFTNVSLSMVFSDTNEMYEEQFYELNKKLGTKALPRIYADIGRAKKNREQFTSKTKNESYIPLSFLQEEHIDADCGVSQTITHLTEKQKLLQSYDYYLNMSGRKSFAEFEYIFAFGEHEVIYRYRKTDINTLQDESLSINDKEVIYYDFAKKEGFTLLEGSDTLNATIKNDSPISRVKYVNSNSILVDNTENKVFKKFIDFVNRMLLFYSLDSRGYEGFMNGTDGIAEGIVNSGKVEEFQEFLKENDIIYDLYACEVDGRKSIYCRFENKDANFFSIASTGTRSLALFYYWYIRMKNAAFVFIDEFDAFYHFELSESVEKRLKEIEGVQIFTTTHNTDLMSNDLLRPDCYFILKDNKIEAISELTQKELRQAHNLQKMYKAGAFNG